MPDPSTRFTRYRAALSASVSKHHGAEFRSARCLRVAGDSGSLGPLPIGIQSTLRTNTWRRLPQPGLPRRPTQGAPRKHPQGHHHAKGYHHRKG